METGGGAARHREGDLRSIACGTERFRLSESGGLVVDLILF